MEPSPHSLKIISVDNQPPAERRHNANKNSREEKIARLEKMWKNDPEQFDPTRTAIDRLRIERTKKVLKEHFPPHIGKAADLGCGFGLLSQFCQEQGWAVMALDASSQALKITVSQVPESTIKTVQDCLPQTRLEDSEYGLVLCTDVIAYLQPIEYRLLMSELARLLTKEGIVVCSTRFDVRSEGALEKFQEVLETEFVLTDWSFSYHRLAVAWLRFLERPHKYLKIKQNPVAFKEKLAKKSRLAKFMLKAWTSPPLSWLLHAADWIFYPLRHLLQQNTHAIRLCEKISKFLWDQEAISHACAVGHRKPVILPGLPTELPRERPQKRSVWE